MSYTNVPTDIIENEIKILPNNNYSNKEYQVLSNNFYNCDIDCDDASSIVSRSASRPNEVNLKSINNTVNPSGTNVDKLSIANSKDVIIGTVYNQPVSIDYLVVGSDDLKDNFNFQYSDNPDPVKPSKTNFFLLCRNKIYIDLFQQPN